MKAFKSFKFIVFLAMVTILALSLSANMVMAQGGGKGNGGGNGGGKGGGSGGGKPGGETAGNNLSFPVIWAEGVAKTLPGTPGMEPVLNGEWWYWWGTSGTDPNIVPLSCAPDPDDETLCDDGIGEEATGNQPGEGWVKAYWQKDEQNIWQAGSADPADWNDAPINVDLIDWGDNLESVDWYTRSQVRAEVVLFEDSVKGDVEDWPMLEYEMRHVSGWGIDEVHGLAATQADKPMVGLGTRATVYSPCARFTIQKLLKNPEDVLIWTWDAYVNENGDPVPGWDESSEHTGDPLINEPIFNKAVHEAEDGPGYYNAEINVKGRIIYGYTWNVKTLNEGAGDYRLTFSFDESCGGVNLNTFFVDGVTEIMVPLEEVEVRDTESEPGGGAAGVLVPAKFDDDGNLIGGNLTYMDVSILERGGGGGGNGGGGGKGSGKPGSNSLMTDEFVNGDRDQLVLDATSVDMKSLSDVNQDGQVDIFDLVFVVSHMGRYNPIADLNGDGTITISDLTIVSHNFD